MRSIFRYSAVLFAAVLIISAGGTCYCDDSPQNLKTFRGQVMDIDWAGSLLTCQGGDETTFYVPSEMRIRDGSDTISLEDLEQGDYVLIEYIDDPTETFKAVSISVDKTYPEF